MSKISAIKTIVTSVMGTTIAMGLIGFPVAANQADLVNQPSNWNQNYENFDFRERRNRRELGNDIKNIVGITGLGIGTGVIAWHLVRANKTSIVKSLAETNNKNRSLLNQVNPKLRKELLRLVSNSQTVNRLLSGTLARHPNRSANWLAEKVIYDLKRDRG